MTQGEFRWQLTEDDPQGALFDEVIERRPGEGQFRGMEFLHVRAKRIINEVPKVSRVPFRYTINAYRGCSHACSYCSVPETPVLMADGRHRPIADLAPGDEIYGTERVGSYRRFVKTEVLAHWRTVKRGYRVVLEDGTELVVSGDHRLLTNRGWKFVTGTGCGDGQRPHLTTTNELLGTGAFAQQPAHDEDYRTGYLCGMIRGDGTLHRKEYLRPNGRTWKHHFFRLALVDLEALGRAQEFITRLGVPTTQFLFQRPSATRAAVHAIRNQSAAGVATIEGALGYPARPSAQWAKGFLAGIFDAEGSYSRGILRIFNTDARIVQAVTEALSRFGFKTVLERQPGTNRPVTVVRVLGGLTEHLRLFHLVDPAITRKRAIEGQAIKNKAQLRVVLIEPLGIQLPMYDITTGTGDFIANGVVSHNCFARPTHEYLNLNAGEDFEKKIVVKVNAVERVRGELASKRWRGEHIAMGTNTDPYQRCEGIYRLTRGIVEALGEARNPFSILTKSTLILRDLDVLAAATEQTDVRADFSVGTLDEEVWRASEPGTPHPRQRLEAVRKLNDAGVECGVLVAPILPGLSDRPEQIEEVVTAALDAGAVSVGGILLHLRPGVKEQYLPWLEDYRPDLMPMYERMYPRSYASKADQARVSEAVTRVLDARQPRPRKTATSSTYRSRPISPTYSQLEFPSR